MMPLVAAALGYAPQQMAPMPISGQEHLYVLKSSLRVLLVSVYGCAMIRQPRLVTRPCRDA